VKRWILIALPNAVTLGGVFAGLLSMAWAPERPYPACLALIAAALCDMVDGRLARLCGTQSAFGAQLDSLADVVSFGLAPAWLIYHWSLGAPGAEGLDPWLLLAFVYVACGAIRLARFNVGADADKPADEFQGVAIPIAAMLLATLVMTSEELGLDVLRSRWIAAPVLLAASGLMVSSWPVPAYTRFRHPGYKALLYGSIAGGVLMLVVGWPGGTLLMALMWLYVSLGLRRAWRGRGAPAPPIPAQVEAR
jgi:CDP-diacylglycerol--serine O-phosphatidyltransferase